MNESLGLAHFLANADPVARTLLAILCAASPGALGGLRGLVHIRAILGNMGVTVLPDQVAVGQAYQAFIPEGGLADAKMDHRVRQLGFTLTRHLAKLLA